MQGLDSNQYKSAGVFQSPDLSNGSLTPIAYRAMPGSAADTGSIDSDQKYRSAAQADSHYEFPEAPVYVEKYTSFMCSPHVSKAPEQVITALTGYFDKSGFVDHTIKTRTRKIKGVAYVNNEPVSFKVCVWRKKGDLLVEVQRRRGDAIAFSKFYADLRAALGALVVSGAAPPSTVLAASALVAPSLAVPPLAGPSALDVVELNSELAGLVVATDRKNNAVNLDAKTIQILCDMVSSESAGQCKYDSARMLATLSETPENQAALAAYADESASKKFTDVVKELVVDPDPEIARCGSTLAANMAKHSGAQKDFCTALLESLVSSIRAPENNILDRERKRQSALALAAMAATGSAVFMKSAVLHLKTCKSHTSDSRLSNSLGTVLSQIDV